MLNRYSHSRSTAVAFGAGERLSINVIYYPYDNQYNYRYNKWIEDQWLKTWTVPYVSGHT
jgi:hypothetical protein